MKEQIEQLNAAIAEFRASNDREIAEVKAIGAATAEAKAQTERANAAITRIEANIAELQASHRALETSNARITPLTAGDARDSEISNARAFFSEVRGRKVVDVTDEDLGSYRSYKSALSEYLRFGDRGLSTDMQNALRTGSNPDGGYWLTPDTSGETVRWIEDLSPIRQEANVITIGTDTHEGFFDLDVGVAGWVGETASRTETNTPRIDGKYAITVHEEYANPKATQKMLDDSENAVEPWLAEKTGRAFALQEDVAFWSGTGISQPFGMSLKTAGTPARTSLANYKKIRQHVTTANGAYVTSSATANGGDVLIDMIFGMPSALRIGAKFYMNALTVALTRKLKDADGQYMLIPDLSAPGKTTLLGYPVIELSSMPDPATNSLSVMFANLKEGYKIVDHRVGTRVLRDPFTAKPYVHFYTTKRVGGDVVNYQAIELLKFGS